MTSIEDLKEKIPPAGSDMFELREGLNRLIEMVAIDSLGRTMEQDDAAVDRDTRIHEKLLYGSLADESQGEREDDGRMRIMSARDTYVSVPDPNADNADDDQKKTAHLSFLKA